MVEIRKQKKTRGGVAKMIFKPKFKSNYENFSVHKIESVEKCDNFSFEFTPKESISPKKKTDFSPVKISYKPAINTENVKFMQQKKFQPTGFLIALKNNPTKIDLLKNKIQLEKQILDLKFFPIKSSIICTVTDNKIIKYGTVNKFYFYYL